MNQRTPRIIGLTGGIGMGKTTVSGYLADRYHLPILDADLYAREAVQPGLAVLANIVDRYGSQILQPDGTLNRKRLGEIVFQDPQERTWLEQQIHPYVGATMIQERDRILETSSTVVLVIPLLFEANLTDRVNEIWVVCCPPEQQLQRLMQREQLTLEQAQARIASQMPIQEKCDRADIILDNSSSLENLLHQVDCALDQPLSELTKSYNGQLD
jgi:dephospho-CoA kinase